MPNAAIRLLQTQSILINLLRFVCWDKILWGDTTLLKSLCSQKPLNIGEISSQAILSLCFSLCHVSLSPYNSPLFPLFFISFSHFFFKVMHLFMLISLSFIISLSFSCRIEIWRIAWRKRSCNLYLNMDSYRNTSKINISLKS